MPAPDTPAALVRERTAVDKALRAEMREVRGVPRRLRAAMAHSLLGGGKRLRPILMLWCWDALARGRRRAPEKRAQVMTAACGLEMLHTYSLIHDDLPAMDDDALRRGQPTCHVAFDEATAILAGDGLQALGFGLLAAGGAGLVAMVGRAVGPAGMVGGQQEDLDAEGGTVTPALVTRIHRRKTACLLAASLAGGALLAGAAPAKVAAVETAGLDLGLAFQGADDVLDAVGSTARLGKSAGKDAGAGKATWVALEGVEKATVRSRRQGERGRAGLAAALPAGPARERLLTLVTMLWNRDF